MCALQAHYGSEFTLYVASDKFAHSAMAGKQHRVHIPVFMLALMLDGVIRLQCELVAFWQLVHMQCRLVTEAIDLAILILAVLKGPGQCLMEVLQFLVLALPASSLAAISRALAMVSASWAKRGAWAPQGAAT